MFLITGANAGIGLETAASLATHHTVMLAGRRPAAVADAVAELKRRPGVDSARVLAAPAPLDLASPASVSAFATALAADLAAKGQRLAVLVNNAGIADAEKQSNCSSSAPTWPVADAVMAVNAVGTHALTRLLLPLLLETAASARLPARVVTLSSRAHTSAPALDPAAALSPGAGASSSSPSSLLSPSARYARSKLANALFASELARRVNKGGAPPLLLSVAVSPGFVRTALAADFASSLPIPAWAARFLTAALAQSPAKGARTSAWAATADPAAVCPPPGRGSDGSGTQSLLPPGYCYAHGARPAPAQLSPQARDAALAAALFEATEGVVAGAGVVLPPLGEGGY
jgi:NAD(P)-dependent dehydrogenase (short-subunit alcohol dehydrogenase family)